MFWDSINNKYSVLFSKGVLPRLRSVIIHRTRNSSIADLGRPWHYGVSNCFLEATFSRWFYYSLFENDRDILTVHRCSSSCALPHNLNPISFWKGFRSLSIPCHRSNLQRYYDINYVLSSLSGPVTRVTETGNVVFSTFHKANIGW